MSISGGLAREKEKAARFIWQLLTFGVYQQAAFPPQRQEGGWWGGAGGVREPLRCYDSAQSRRGRQEIKKEGKRKTTRVPRAARGRINSNRVLVFCFVLFFFFFYLLARLGVKMSSVKLRCGATKEALDAR